MIYKVVFHEGETIGLETKVDSGRLSIEQDRLLISGKKEVSILFRSLISVELFRLHGTMRMLKIVHSDGTIFVTVVRFSLFSQFALGNYFATGELRDKIDMLIKKINLIKGESIHGQACGPTPAPEDRRGAPAQRYAGSNLGDEANESCPPPVRR
jgi:hypothetical protein